MRRKVSSTFLCVLLIANMLGVMIQNVGESSFSRSGIEITSDSISQNVDVSSLSGTGGLANSSWPMFGQNPRHTGLSPYNTSANNGQLKWSFTTDGYFWSTPAIGPDDTIYINAGGNKLYAIYPNGTEKWSFMTIDSTKIYGSPWSTPAIGSDGTIYFGANVDFEVGKLYAVNPDGSEKWNFTFGHNVLSSPAIGPDGTIYVGSDDRNLYAINPDGTQKWSFKTVFWIESCPAIGSDGTIYVYSVTKLYAIHPNGTEKWSLSNSGFDFTSPAIGSDGTIYITSWPSFWAINPDGTRKWSFTATSDAPVDTTPSIGPDGTIYMRFTDNLYAINPDGSKKWSFPLEGGSIRVPQAIGSEGTIYIGTTVNRLYAINPDGTEKWHYTTGNEESLCSPAIGSDGTIYISSYLDWSLGKLYAIGTQNQTQPPVANAGPDQTVNEGDTIQFDGSASNDPDGAIESYEWDFDSNDGLWWETGVTPDATGPTPTHVYGDDGVYIATLRVTDNDNLSASDICNITVLNVNPTVTIESTIMEVEIGLRVAGRKYNNVSMTLYEEGIEISQVSIERLPGSPNEQMAWIPYILDMTKTYSATVTYEPADPPNVGGNPVWIYIKSQNGSIKKIHHTFNVQQSNKRDSEHWNHVEPWEVDLNVHLIGFPFEVSYHVTDPGSDDETLTFTYGSQNVTVIHLNNPPNPDPYPSPDVNPRNIKDSINLVYEGSGTVILIVKDDDNIRLGIG